ncbi:MAG: Molybdopterin molybdenumtransferase [Anaerolineales bacterium]|nr:Molybdopterin molybdenumtransferase [Anaerolineales bacterium]
MTLLSVNDARAQILASLRPVTTTRVALELAAGRVLAENIRAESDFPHFDNSSMDGFALRAGDSAPGQTLRVTADIPAGSASLPTLKAGEAARIMTGAPLPPGADAVIAVEETDFTNRTAGSAAPEKVIVQRAVRPGENVRLRGADLREGEVVLHAGRRLRAQDVGLLAMLGAESLTVFARPRVTILSSGDELVPVGQPLTPGKIHDSNSYALAAQVESTGAQALRLGAAKDERAAVQALLDRAAESADLIVATAGVSVGAFDFVKEVVESNGTLNFWKVNMRPGKPLAFGEYRGVPFMGLPGNPVSAFVTFEVFARPALEKLAGATMRPRATRPVILAEAIESDGRESYLRAVVDPVTNLARLAGHQGSGNLFSLVQANALLIIPAGVKSRPAGKPVDAWLF